jgi:3-oxo-5alpha-steroid 4-dehydrogenase
MDPNSPQWASPVEAPLVRDGESTGHWDDMADLVVVGYGGAGVAAALEAAERGVNVLALDRYEGGGSSAANGGVFYAGGGTRIQREAGVQDSPEEMFKYLQIETQGVVSEQTLRSFCDDSAATVEWLLAHGALLSSQGVFAKKVSYPPLQYHLYHPDNSLVPAYAARARPAARGHRTAVDNAGKAWGLGWGIWKPLAAGGGPPGERLPPPACASTNTPRCASWSSTARETCSASRRCRSLRAARPQYASHATFATPTGCWN